MDKDVQEILLHEVRELRKELQELRLTVTTLKVKFGTISLAFGAIGGIAIKIYEIFFRHKG